MSNGLVMYTKLVDNYISIIYEIATIKLHKPKWGEDDSCWSLLVNNYCYPNLSYEDIEDIVNTHCGFFVFKNGQKFCDYENPSDRGWIAHKRYSRHISNRFPGVTDV